MHNYYARRNLPDDMNIVSDEQEGRSALSVDVCQEL